MRLYLNLGRKDGVSSDEVLALLTSEGVALSVRDIDLMNTHSYVNVGAADAERLCRALTEREHNGRKLLCETARPPRRR